MDKLAPVVIFVYNRLFHLQQTIEALKKNEYAEKSNVFIFSDYAKDRTVEKEVKEVRNYIKSIKGFNSVTIIEREKNYGLAANIIDGVTNLIKKYKKVIVLEDDLVTSPYFLRYMNDALEFYKNENRVMHISGYMYPIYNEGLPDTFFIKPTSCWGWATWERAWRYYKKDVDFYLRVFNRQMIKDFNLNNTYGYYSQIIDNKKGKINTWAIFWYASVYLRNGLSLHPKESFVKNIGHDGKGVHCSKTNVFDVKLTQKYPVEFTKNIEENIEARKRLEQYFKSIKPSFYKRFFNKVNKVYKLLRL